LGRDLFGDTWQFATLMLLGLAVHSVTRTPFTTITAAMRSLDMRRKLAFQRLAASALLLGSATLASLSGDISLIPWAMAGAAGLSSVVVFVSLRRRVSQLEHDDHDIDPRTPHG
jgi:hypothetical protein